MSPLAEMHPTAIVVRNLSTEHDSLLSVKVSRFKNSTALFCFHESLPAS